MTVQASPNPVNERASDDNSGLDEHVVCEFHPPILG